MRIVKIKIFILSIFLCSCFPGDAQDTSAIIKDLNKILSFALSNNLRYTAFVKSSAEPALQKEDTASYSYDLFKTGSSLFYRSQAEEVLLQDSLLFSVDKNQKIITITRADPAVFSRLSGMPLDQKGIQKLFREKFSVSRQEISKSSSEIHIETSKINPEASTIRMQLSLRYAKKTMLPEQMILKIFFRQETNEDEIKAIKEEGIKTDNLLVRTGDQIFIVRTQQMEISFHDINTERQEPAKSKDPAQPVVFDTATSEYTVAPGYAAYQIIKSY